jgi:hypothetical protein
VEPDGFSERSHENVRFDGRCRAETPTLVSEHTQAVRFIYDETGAKRVAESTEYSEVRRICIHAEVGLGNHPHSVITMRIPIENRTDGVEVEVGDDAHVCT